MNSKMLISRRNRENSRKRWRKPSRKPPAKDQLVCYLVPDVCNLTLIHDIAFR